MLPPSETFVYWVGNFVPGSLNVLIALLAYELLDPVSLAGWRAGLWSRLRLSACLPLAGLLFLASMCIYPSTTLFILVPTFCSLVFSSIESWPQTRCRVLRDVVFTVAGVCGYFLLTQHIIRPILGQTFSDIQHAIDGNQAGLYQLAVTRDVVAWLQNFWAVLTVALCGALHPFLRIASSQSVARAVAGSLALVAVWRFLRPQTAPSGITARAQRGYLLQAGLALLGLLALSECPVIVPAGASGFAPYRVVYPASAMMVLLVVSILARCRLPLAFRAPAWLARPLPACLLLAGAWLGHIVLCNAATNAHSEMVTFREQLRGLDLRATKALLIIGPAPGMSFTAGAVRADLAMFATGGSFVPGFASAMLAEKGYRPGEITVRYRQFDPDSEYSIVIAEMPVVDMNVATRGAKKRYFRQPRALIDASGETCYLGNMMGAFDGDPFSFWQVQGANQTLQVDYGQPYQLAEYSLRTLDPPERMPVNWQVLGSNDGAAWALVDQQHGQSVWAPAGSRTFPLAKRVGYRRYKIVFTGGRSDILRIADWSLRHESSARMASLPNGSRR
jgi:hypothetical protein